MNEKVPIFGAPPPGEEPRSRQAVYGVARDEGGRIAVVRGTGGWFLPGGGVKVGETLREALIREVAEEIRHHAEALRIIGRAREYVRRRSRTVELQAAFYAMTLGTKVAGEPDHPWDWAEPTPCLRHLARRSHAWAVRRILAP